MSGNSGPRDCAATARSVLPILRYVSVARVGDIDARLSMRQRPLPSDSTTTTATKIAKTSNATFQRTLRILAADRAGDTVHRALEHARAVRVREQPHRRQDVLERLPRVIGAHDEIAERVARHLLRGHRLHLRVHRVARALRGLDEVDLVALDDPAGDESGVVGLQLAGRKRLDAAQQVGVDADRRADEIVVEEVLQPPGRGLPAHVLHLARLRAPVLFVSLGRVVVVPGLGGPFGVDARVERPVRQIDAAHGVGERLLRERRRREPQLAVPRADLVARRGIADLKRQHALRTERGLRLLVGHELRRAAEFAVLRLPLRDRAPRSRCSSGT